ncbi:MAG: glycosyltransferase family 2 protein [Methylacidiphilales bacterium]|nr:glycosyltransferase family 2 protein [Candidatus Methylacidiphilales bacterium]
MHRRVNGSCLGREALRRKELDVIMPGPNRFLSDRPPSISVVIPVYRSAPTIAELVGRLCSTLSIMTDDFEIVLVNDGSPDDSWKAITTVLPQYPQILAIDLLRNYDQHNALLCGIRAATKEVIVTMDDDLQHLPEEIPHLVAALNEEADVVYGIYRQAQFSFYRRWTSTLSKYIVSWLAGGNVDSKGGSFRAFPTRLREAFDGYHSTFVAIDVLLHWSTSRFGMVDVRHDPRKVGQSNYTLFKLWNHFINIITAFSTRPLRVISLVGLAFTLLGFAILGYVLINYVRTRGAVPGFAFLGSMIALFSGAQMFALGVFGEYLARMHTRLMDRPPYTINRTVRGGTSI